MNAVRLDSLCKSFGDVRAVDGLSVSVPAGSIYGFLGPNGAGKTTTLRMIMNIIRPDSGRIEVLSARSDKLAKERIGYMPEERGLYRKMTVAGALGYFGALRGLPSRELARRVPQWLRRVELNGWADKKVEELSKGMQQKLQFAVTCINDPELLILDEPFAGLDPVNLELLKEIILGMHRDGKTVLFSTHIMDEAERLCQYILLINGGRQVLNGALDEIRSSRRSRTVSVELEGDTGFVQALPMVSGIRPQGRRMDIDLAEQADPQQFLAAIVGKVKVFAFEVRAPSLHEIFVSLVGRGHAQDS